MSETRTSDASAGNISPQIDLEAFRRRYLAHAARQLPGRTNRELSALAREHLELGVVRPDGETLIRSHNMDGDTSAIDIVTPDAPFLVDSIRAEFDRAGQPVSRLLHPQIVASRDADGRLEMVYDLDDNVEVPKGAIIEAWMHIETDRLEPADAERLIASLRRVLNDVHLAAADAPAMYALIRELADRLTDMMVRGPVRKGEALLAGLLRCGHCGRRLLVSYNGTKGDVGRYNCDATRSNPGAAPCISFGALRVDEAVGAEIVRLLQPLGVEAAIQAITQCEHQSGEKQRQIELALEQARYEATRARRQYDTVDPDNRLVAGELERRWNAALAAVRALGEELEALLRQRPATLSAEERKRLLQMGVDLRLLGTIPAATALTRKRIIRVVLREVVACVEDDQIYLCCIGRAAIIGEKEPEGANTMVRRA